MRNSGKSLLGPRCRKWEPRTCFLKEVGPLVPHDDRGVPRGWWIGWFINPLEGVLGKEREQYPALALRSV